VALALLGLIAATLMASLQFSRRSYQKVSRVNTAAWEIFSAQRTIRDLLESAYPSNDLRGHQRGIVGSSARAEVVAPALRGGTGAGFLRYRFEVQRRDDHEDLMVRWVSDLGPDNLDRIDVSEEVLVKGIASARWEYCCSNTNNAGEATWESSWSEPVMPRLIRLRVDFPRGDARVWPALIAAPRVTEDANCVFDIVSQSCRTGP
jgi:hypothetical protein